MNTSIRIKTNVMPGNKIEIISNKLHPGEVVDVYIVLPRIATEKRLSIVDLLKKAPPPSLFKTRQEIDKYIAEERNSWER